MAQIGTSQVQNFGVPHVPPDALSACSIHDIRLGLYQIFLMLTLKKSLQKRYFQELYLLVDNMLAKKHKFFLTFIMKPLFPPNFLENRPFSPDFRSEDLLVVPIFNTVLTKFLQVNL